MPDVIIFGDTVRSPELRHEVPITVPDPFVYVERKVPAESLASDELLPAEIEGVPVDVVATGPIEPLPSAATGAPPPAPRDAGTQQ